MDRFTTALRADGPYGPPSAADGAAVEGLVDAVLAGCADPAPAGLAAAAARAGFGVHDVGGRRLLLSDPDAVRAWGLVVLPAVVGDRAPQVVVEIPHPHSDLRTERVGLGVTDRLDAALLLQAGAHRHAWRAPWRGRGGAPTSPPTSRTARTRCSPGSPPGSSRPAVPRRCRSTAARTGTASMSSRRRGPHRGPRCSRRSTRGLREAGERVRGGGDPGCEALSGTRNVQGRLAARLGTPFVHLELCRSLRADARRRETVARVVADAVAATGSATG